MFSPKPGQRNLSSSSRRNQLTRKMRGGFGDPAAHVQPVAEIIGHVVAAERQHRHRIAARRGDADRRRGGFRAHRRGQIDAVAPVERLEHQRHVLARAAAEDERADRHAGGVFPVGIDATGTALAGAVKREFGCAADAAAAGRPILALSSRSDGLAALSVMPSHQTSPSSVSAVLVKIALLAQLAIAFGFDLRVGAGGDAEEAGFRVDRAQVRRRGLA